MTYISEDYINSLYEKKKAFYNLCIVINDKYGMDQPYRDKLHNLILRINSATIFSYKNVCEKIYANLLSTTCKTKDDFFSRQLDYFALDLES